MEETFTISEENWIKKNTRQKACEKPQQQRTGNINRTKQRASSEGEKITILEENCI